MSETQDTPILKKCLSFALFGHGKPDSPNCFSPVSYLRGLLMHVRMSRLLYPNFEIVLEIDEPTYNAYYELLDNLPIIVNINYEDAPLTKAMLWRMKPVFLYEQYGHVLCRDLDSPPTYREAQAVQDWINGDKGCHAITDSISHTVPLLGGMVGFRPQYFPMRTGYQHWHEMFEGVNIDFSRKGADQDFLNKYIYPHFAKHSHPDITQHYILGMPNTFLNGFKNYIPDLEVDCVSRDLQETNDCASHIGQAGWLFPQTFKIMKKYQDRFADLFEVEKKFPTIAFWVNDGTFED